LGVEFVVDGVGGGGFEGGTGGPETVGMAVLVALAFKADIATGGDGFADGPEIGGQETVFGNADGFVLEGATELVGEFFFERGGEGEAFDLGVGEMFFGAFDELTAESVLVNAGSLDRWQGDGDFGAVGDDALNGLERPGVQGIGLIFHILHSPLGAIESHYWEIVLPTVGRNCVSVGLLEVVGVEFVGGGTWSFLRGDYKKSLGEKSCALPNRRRKVPGFRHVAGCTDQS
jgi:hypothetical protein